MATVSTNRSSRRSFLLSTTASAVAASLPTVGTATPSVASARLAEQPAAPATSGTVYAIFEEFFDGNHPTEFYPSRQQWETRQKSALFAGDREHPVKPVSVQFSDTKFRVTLAKWNSYGDRMKMMCYRDEQTPKDLEAIADSIEWTARLTGFDVEKIKADVAAMKAGARDFCEMPRHTLDVPSIQAFYHEEQIHQGEIVSRPEAMKLVAELNKGEIGEGRDRKEWARCMSRDWFIVLELGEIPHQAALSIVEYHGDIGVEFAHVYRPVRVVRPTEAEIAQYSKPLDWDDA